jgi:uncharacterized protein YcnI
MFRPLVLGAFGAALGIGVAAAHISLETAEAPVGAVYKAVLRVPHGCAGSATTAIRVRIPDGVIGVRPMPKPGWTLGTVTGKYPQRYRLFQAIVSEGVVEIAWSGGSLADAHYDEFVFQAYLSDALAPGATIHFPVVQECEKGVHRWIDVTPSHAGGDHGEPAPALKLLPRR